MILLNCFIQCVGQTSILRKSFFSCFSHWIIRARFFACPIWVRADGSRSLRYRNFGPTHPGVETPPLLLLLEPEQMPHTREKTNSYCATNRKSSVGSHAYTRQRVSLYGIEYTCSRLLFVKTFRLVTRYERNHKMVVNFFIPFRKQAMHYK